MLVKLKLQGVVHAHIRTELGRYRTQVYKETTPRTDTSLQINLKLG